MIRSFRNKGLRRFAEKGDLQAQRSKPGSSAPHSRCLDGAKTPAHMDLPGLQFHLLKGADKGRYSVWPSGNWRVTFGWSGEDAIDIDLEDYH